MAEHPIENLMVTAMNSIKEMIDVNTIIGNPIQAPDNIIIIPISKVSFGFGAGGSEFAGETLDNYTKVDKQEQINYKLPFGGGAGAGVSISPIAFIVISGGNVKLIPVNHASAIDKLLDYVPDLIEKTTNMMNKCIDKKKDKENKKNNDNNKDDLNDLNFLDNEMANNSEKTIEQTSTIKEDNDMNIEENVIIEKKKIKRPENKPIIDLEDE